MNLNERSGRLRAGCRLGLQILQFRPLERKTGRGGQTELV